MLKKEHLLSIQQQLSDMETADDGAELDPQFTELLAKHFIL